MEIIVKVEYFVYIGIAITAVLGIAGEFSIRKKRREDKEQDIDGSK
jgi:hypothetical protein